MLGLPITGPAMATTSFHAALLLCSITLTQFTNAQANWTAVELPGNHPEVFALTTHGAQQQLFIGTGGLPGGQTNATGILWSNDHGMHVKPRANGILDTRFDLLIRSLHSSKDLLIAASADGPYFSSDVGETWQKRADGLPVVRQTSMRSANALTSLGDVIFCGTPQGIYRTSDAGRHWTLSSEGLATLDVRALTRLNTTLFASTDGDGVYRSKDSGKSWQHASKGIPSGVRSRAILAADGVVIAGTQQGTFRSLDMGTSWTPTLPNANARSFAATNGLIAIGAFRGAGSIYISRNQGQHWFDVSANLPRGGIGVWAITFDDRYLYAAVNRHGLWRVPRSELDSMMKVDKSVNGTASNTGMNIKAAPTSNLLAALDRDRNGELSGAEIERSTTALLTLDTNGDGKLSAAELSQTDSKQPQFTRSATGKASPPTGRRPNNGSGALANLMKLDANGDGKLTQAEVPARMQRIFDRADSDKNGTLDQAEIERFSRQLGPGRGR